MGKKTGKSKDSISILTQKYKEKLKIKTNGEFDLVNTYNDKVVDIYHKECGRISQLNPRYFLSKLSCPLCEKDKRYDIRLEKTKQIVADFKIYLEHEVGNEYTITKDYMNPNERKVSIMHSCGHKYKVKINSFKSGRRCPICTKTQPKPPEEYLKEFNEVSDGKFSLLTSYQRATKKVDILCNKCNKKSSVNPSYFLRDPRCPKCEKNTNSKKQ